VPSKTEKAPFSPSLSVAVLASLWTRCCEALAIAVGKILKPTETGMKK